MQGGRANMCGMRGVSLLVLLGLCSPVVHAFEPPTGFNDHNWGSPLVAFRGLTLWHANTAAGTRGRVTDFKLQCERDPATGDTCSPRLSRVTQIVQGDGAFALGEYYFAKDRNPWAAQDVDLLTISYLFCASAKGQYLPAALRRSLQLCGARVLFKSEPAALLAGKAEDYLSNYDRLLRVLIGRFGAPPGYQPRGEVVIQSLDEAAPSGPKAQKSVHFHWCGLDVSSKALQPTCTATVTLAFDADRGEGSVLFATAPLYAYAFARHDLGDVNNDLYRLLGDRPLDEKPQRLVFECTGTRICGAGHDGMSARELRAFDP
jgi:hypothetical protein